MKREMTFCDRLDTLQTHTHTHSTEQYLQCNQTMKHWYTYSEHVCHRVVRHTS